MARVLGCSSAGYLKWEQGTAKPSAEWLLRLLQLCPDERTRNEFRIRAERRSRPRDSAPEHARAVASLAAADPQARRDAARTAVHALCACAEAGDEKAGERLRQFAENLRSAAQHFERRREPQ